MINEFRDEYFFLSNFYPCQIKFGEITYQNSEAAFQAQKTLDLEERKQFANLNASQVKRLGRKVNLRKDWEDVKDIIMESVVREKFLQHKDLLNKLLETNDEELIEGTTWNDRYWGIDLNTGIGRNKLGNILMKIREEFKNA